MEPNKIGTAPYIVREDSTVSIMADVLYALLPSLIWGFYVFGKRAIVITAFSVICAVLFELASQLILKRKISVFDLSSIVTAVIFSMIIPVSVPMWIVPLGMFIAICLIKQSFGGIGKNILNPALFSRVILDFIFPSSFSKYTLPFAPLNTFSINISENLLEDYAANITPLESLKSGIIPEKLSMLDLCMGKYAGDIGTASSVLIILGLLYLIVKKVVSWHIPTAFIVSSAALTFIFPRFGARLDFTLWQILSGAFLFGAAFLATDPVTTPITKWGKTVFGVICGVLTVIFRYFVPHGDGVFYAILIADVLTLVIDRIFLPTPYGVKKNIVLRSLLKNKKARR